MSSGPHTEGVRPRAANANGRGAVIALVVAALGAVAFGVGLRSALRRLPPEQAAGAPGAAARPTTPEAIDSARAHQFAPPPPNEPDAYPRLR